MMGCIHTTYSILGGKLDLRYLKILGDQMDVLWINFLSPRISLISLVLVGPIWEVVEKKLQHKNLRPENWRYPKAAWATFTNANLWLILFEDLNSCTI